MNYLTRLWNKDGTCHSEQIKDCMPRSYSVPVLRDTDWTRFETPTDARPRPIEIEFDTIEYKLIALPVNKIANYMQT